MTVSQPAASSAPSPRLAGATAIVLSFAAGATDAFAFVMLGGVFTANMTGNLVLVGLTQRPGYPSMIVWIAVVLIVFAGTLFLVLRFTTGTAPPRRLLVVLGLGVVTQAGVLIGWLAIPDPTALLATSVLLALSAVAMAAQTAVGRRIELRSGVSTTYVTGTITAIAADFADRRPQDFWTRIGVISALVAGALSDSLLIAVAPAFGAALPLLPAVIGLAMLARLSGHPAPGSTDGPRTNGVGPKPTAHE